MVTKHTPHRYTKDQTTRTEISDYMSSTVISIGPDSTVPETAKLMHEKNIGSVLVKDKEDYIGIVTETDLTRKVLGGGLDPKTTKVTAVMTAQPIITLDCHQPVTEANAVMAKKKVRHLPITENDKIVGMISVKDLVAFYANPRLR
ncbi:MAG: CBS domain-containing protein [Nitrospina sp.]|jgi:CBS domain-containing protein|nr:CBS domain-containing protein [Nitrospina sp.]MBT3414269.1 CBS domain-containing protein [Nitrospina sp.]MBT3857351.1 CBS domain-containing protein [Nitrospina sp.]MBT4103918.1 CBS domain-containing protein [Nitrospina sp.]MBT4388935.1 CBS domain-containing protein [Nitrospina sp.]